MVREEGVSSLARGVGPNVFRAVLMNASQLASYVLRPFRPLPGRGLTRVLGCRYDFFKAELLKSGYFQDNIYLHTTASFAAGTVATTVCSPADVLKVRPLLWLSMEYAVADGGLCAVESCEQSRIMSASGAESKSTMQMIRLSMQREGPMFMFRGWLPAWTRLQPTTMLIFITLEQLKNAVDWYRGDL